MKLSELSTDKALDVLCELSPYVSNIAEDEQVLSSLDGFMNQSADAKDRETGKGEDGKGEEASMSAKGLRFFGGLIKNIPLLLKTHRADVYGILSVMNERPVAEIAAQKLMDTMRQVKELFQDEDFVAFFKSSAQEAQNEPSAPSASSPA